MSIPKGTFEHAKIVNTRWGQVLAFIEMRDDTDCECLRIQLWAPVGEDGGLGQVTFRIGLGPEAPDEAHEKMERANRKALQELTAEKAESVISAYGVDKMLDAAFAQVAS